jgi:hypothetical protein
MATPARLPVPGAKSRDARHWVIRLASNAPTSLRVEDLSVELTRAAQEGVAQARRERGLSGSELVSSRPDVAVHELGAMHLLVIVQTSGLENDSAHSYLVAAARALGALESRFPIADIQGFPREYWGLLLGERAQL